MEFFKWKNDYSVKNEILDGEHKKLIGIINELYISFMNREENEKLGEMLSKLQEYTIYHFSHEEELLKERNNPLSATHKAKHNDFIEKVKSMKEKHEKGTTEIKYEMMNFLRSWLTDHIIGTDKKYSFAFEKDN